MVYFTTTLLPEIQSLPVNDKEKIISDLHWAIAEDLPKMVIQLNNFRDGEELHISNYDFSELYKGISSR